MNRRQKIVSLLVVGMMAAMPLASAVAATTIGNNVAIGGTLSVTGATTLTGAASLSSTLTVTGVTLHSGNLNASSSVFLSGVATSTVTTFAVNPTATLVGGFISNASSSVSTLNAATLAIGGVSTFTGLSTLTGGFISNASSTIGGTLSVSGAATVSSTLLVSSLTTLQSGFISNASSSVGAGLQVAGALNVSSSLLVSGLSTLGNANISGSFYATSTQPFLFSGTSGTSTLYASSTSANTGARLILGRDDGVCVALYFSKTYGISSTTITCP